MTSRLFAQHLAQRPDSSEFGRIELVSGTVPNTELPSRHYWLEVDEMLIDLTADPFGEAPVVVGRRTAFHASLTSPTAEHVSDVLASLSTDERARLMRQLAVIESRLPGFDAPAA
jgi:hypothetical protein